MSTREEVVMALRRAQELSDRHWHCLDQPVALMAGGRTWTGPAADAFAGELARRRTEVWQALRDVIAELDDLLARMPAEGRETV
ncbi:hypothetical protein [Nonomuraea pusilla]|uniref:Uncharacterized protein n=1 Tax=Nonomuraea pusilla TaxID=46177 RepID=A0A1H7US19_9ACTN|nr:hypothetical protein [Nonomuraea pusilla]SEL99780.1 hypothetical protein SAMN05660976_03934 [Nonomuraea pusilla]